MSTSCMPSDPNCHEIALASYAGVHHRQVLYGEVVRALGQGQRRIVVDCRGWQQLDVRLLSILVRCAQACRDDRAEFALVNVGVHVRRGLEELRLDGKLGISGS